MKFRTAWIAGVLSLLGTAAHAQYNFDHLLSAGNLVQVSPHVWVIRGFPNIGIVVGEKGTLVVDTGLGPSNGAIAAKAAQSLSPQGQKLYLTTTHYHPEHASGDVGFPAGTPVIRPRVQQTELEAREPEWIDTFSKRSEQDKALLAGVAIRTADVQFGSSYNVDLGGGVRVRLLRFGPAHTRGDEVVMVNPDSVLLSGDVVQNKTGPNFDCEECGPATWAGVLDQVAQLKPRIILPDHSPPGDGSLIAAEQDFMMEIARRAQALKAAGKTPEETRAILLPELMAKYKDWGSMTHLADGIERAYEDR